MACDIEVTDDFTGWWSELTAEEQEFIAPRPDQTTETTMTKKWRDLYDKMPADRRARIEAQVAKDLAERWVASSKSWLDFRTEPSE